MKCQILFSGEKQTNRKKKKKEKHVINLTSTELVQRVVEISFTFFS